MCVCVCSAKLTENVQLSVCCKFIGGVVSRGSSLYTLLSGICAKLHEVCVKFLLFGTLHLRTGSAATLLWWIASSFIKAVYGYCCCNAVGVQRQLCLSTTAAATIISSQCQRLTVALVLFLFCFAGIGKYWANVPNKCHWLSHIAWDLCCILTFSSFFSLVVVSVVIIASLLLMILLFVSLLLCVFVVSYFYLYLLALLLLLCNRFSCSMISFDCLIFNKKSSCTQQQYLHLTVYYVVVVRNEFVELSVQ